MSQAVTWLGGGRNGKEEKACHARYMDLIQRPHVLGGWAWAPASKHGCLGLRPTRHATAAPCPRRSSCSAGRALPDPDDPDGGWLMDRDLSWQHGCARQRGRGGVPLSRPRRRGSARGSEPCAVPCHLCAVLGCTVHRGVEPHAARRAPEGGRIPPPARVVHASVTTTCSTLMFCFTPGDRTAAGWTAECVRRARVSARPGRRPANAVALPARR
jgi:hypothetical protein